jgi:hypothetical protein
VNPDTLTTYLNDHLAGSVVAVGLLEHLRELSKGTQREKLFAGLQSEIEEDQAVLQGLLRDLGEKESRIRKTAAWLAEKLAEVKLKFDDSGSGELALLEALESLGLGVLGKLSLWRALELGRESVPELRKLDFERLKSRAVAQHDRIEAERRQAARSALGF